MSVKDALFLERPVRTDVRSSVGFVPENQVRTRLAVGQLLAGDAVPAQVHGGRAGMLAHGRDRRPSMPARLKLTFEATFSFSGALIRDFAVNKHRSVTPRRFKITH